MNKQSKADMDKRIQEMGWKRKVGLFEEGLSFIYLFLGWLWECAARLWRGRK